MLEELNFNYDIVTFYSKNHLFVGKDENMMFHKNTILTSDYDNPKPFGIEYLQVSSTSTDKLASYGNIYFPVINTITDLQDKIGLICVRKEIKSNELEKLINLISEKEGKYKKSQGNFFSNYDILTWENKARIFKLCIVFDNENNTIKLNINKNTGAITSGKKTPHFNCYLFIGNKNQKKLLEILNKQGQSGDFVYF